MKGHALHLLGRFAEAIMCYDKALMVKPAHVPAPRQSRRSDNRSQALPRVRSGAWRLINGKRQIESRRKRRCDLNGAPRLTRAGT